MNLLITNECSGACLHCMQDSRPNTGQHMPVDRAFRAIEWVVGIHKPLNNEHLIFDQILISGGEPLQHPEFFRILDYACARIRYVTIATNGLMLDDRAFREAFMSWVDGLKGPARPEQIRVQVTYAKGLYPHKPAELDRFATHPSFQTVKSLDSGLTRIGRGERLLNQAAWAKEERPNRLPSSSNSRLHIHGAEGGGDAPVTFADVIRSLRRAVRSFHSLRDLRLLTTWEAHKDEIRKTVGEETYQRRLADIQFIQKDALIGRMQSGFCAPAVRFDGQISLGEWMTCATVGDFEEPDAVLLERARALGSCNRCGLEKNLEPKVRTQLFGRDMPIQDQSVARARALPNGQQGQIKGGANE